jgi:NAD(P)H-flavin reductase
VVSSPASASCFSLLLLLLLLLQELDAMARDNPERFHLWYVVEEPGTPPSPIVHGADAAAAATPAAAAAAPWTHSRGYITWDMMAQHLLPPQPVVVMPSGSDQQQQQRQQGGSLALMCGPPGMLEHVVVPGLTAMGYTAEQMVVF